MTPPRVAYILSPSYSGSTLLTLLLARHPEVATIGELKAHAMGDIDRYVCSCGEKILACPFWAAVGSAMQARGRQFNLADFGTGFRAPGRWLSDRLLRASYRGFLFELARKVGLRVVPWCRQATGRMLAQNRAMIEAVLELQNGRVFLDGSKDVIRLKHMLDAGFWDIKIIHLIRDGRGATNSYMRHHDVDMQTAAAEWVRAQHEAQRLLDPLGGGSWVTVQYERLCREPDATVADILDFMGCDSSVDASASQAIEHHILGNSMRLKPLRNVELDEKWRRQLTPDELQVFERIAGKVNSSLGYE